MKIKRILFPTDFSEASNRALDHALVLAHRFEATLIMLYVEVLHGSDPHNPRKDFPDLEPLFSFLREQVSGHVENPDLPIISGTIAIREESRRGISAADEILNFAEEEDVDLIIMGTHGHQGLERFLLGSTTEKVVHGTQRPILTMGHGEDLFLQTSGKYKRILFPIDYSDASHSAVLYGLHIAELNDAEVVFTHVNEPVLTSLAFFSGTIEEAEEDPELEQRSELALHKFLDDKLPKNYEFYLSSGSAHREIIKTAKDRNCDLIILADKGWTKLDRLLLGSTTEKLIRKSHVPVLVTKK